MPEAEDKPGLRRLLAGKSAYAKRAQFSVDRAVAAAGFGARPGPIRSEIEKRHDGLEA